MTSGWYVEEEQKEQMDFAHQKEMIKQLKAFLEEDVDENLKESFKGNPTETLIRLLKASDWNVQRAHKMLLHWLQWRVQNSIDNILVKPIIPTDLYMSSEHCKFTCQHEEAVIPLIIADVESLYRAYNKSDGSNVPSYDQLDYVAEGIGRDIVDGSIISMDGIPGLVQVTNENCHLLSMTSHRSCPDEYFAVKKGFKCYPCVRVEAFEDGLKVMKNKFGISDFLHFVEAWKAGDKKTVPFYLGYVHNAFGCNVTATTTHCNDMIALPLGLFYATIDEMHKMKLEDIMNEDVILKWGCVMRDAKKMGLDVAFAEEHLKKIAHAYFLSKGPVAESNKEELCSMSERESFDDGAPLTKGLLLFTSSEQSA